MLKECYYFDQAEFDYQDYMFLCRYIDRMIQYRDSTKGSYDGEKRLSEISKINLSRVTEHTKKILSYYIRLHNAYDLFKLNNLKELSLLEECDLDFLNKYKKLTYINDKDGLEYRKSSLEDFYKYLSLLNTEISRLKAERILPEDYIFEIKSISGFAMIYHNLRESGLTTYIDNINCIDYTVKDLIKTIAKHENLPDDWISDDKAKYYDISDFHWTPVKWRFGRKSNIKAYVCSTEDLLKIKLPLAESYLEHLSNNERINEIDYTEARNILVSMHLEYGSKPSLIKEKFSQIGIVIDSYPNMYNEIILSGNDT